MAQSVDGFLTCKDCKITKPEIDFYWIKTRNTYHTKCKPCYRSTIAAIHGPLYREKLKKETFEAYGGACVCCGETWFAFLCIDHIEGGGNTDRKALTGSHLTAGVVFYRVLRRQNFPSGYQILCFNCNMAKDRTGGCPDNHKLYTRKEKGIA